MVDKEMLDRAVFSHEESVCDLGGPPTAKVKFVFHQGGRSYFVATCACQNWEDIVYHVQEDGTGFSCCSLSEWEADHG